MNLVLAIVAALSSYAMAEEKIKPPRKRHQKRNRSLGSRRMNDLGLRDLQMSMPQCQNVDKVLNNARKNIDNAKKVVEKAQDNIVKHVLNAADRGCVTTLFDMYQLNDALASYSYDDVGPIKAAFEQLGYNLISTPTFGHIAESLGGTAGITALGQFNLDEFDCSGSPISPTSGFSDTKLIGHPHMLFAGFGPAGYTGIAAQVYPEPEYVGAELKDLFSPNKYRDLLAYILNADGTEVVDVSGTTRTIYSNRQHPGPNGYYSTSEFSDDDGVWGFSIGSSVDGDDGPWLHQNQASSYGCENADWIDDGTDSRKFYWGSASDTDAADYAFYFAVKREGTCA